MTEPNSNDGIWVLDQGRYAHFHFSNNIPSKLLRYMIQRPHAVVSRDDILANVWGLTSHTSAQERLPENHFSALRAVLGDEQVPKYANGYQIAPHATGVLELGPASPFAIGSSAQARPCEVRVFPTSVKLHPRGHVLSKLDSGKNDAVMTDVYVYSKIECSEVKIIPYDNEDWALKISFSHKRTELSPEEDWKESYWYAVIGLTGSSQDEWQTVDLSRHQVLRFDARASSKNNQPIPLRVRLKDHSATLNKINQYQQSTNWSSTFTLLKNYREKSFEIDLGALKWDVLAWPENSADVSRSAIHHIVIGHDSSDASMEGTIYLRNIRFEAE